MPDELKRFDGHEHDFEDSASLCSICEITFEQGARDLLTEIEVTTPEDVQQFFRDKFGPALGLDK